MSEKIALVTGASRGIGLNFCYLLEQKGYTVYAGVLKPGNYPDHPSIRELVMDITQDDAIQTALAQIQQEAGHLDLLVNNAGINKDTATGGHKELACTLESLDREVLLRMQNVNAVSPLMVVKYALPLLTGEHCFIINISSDRASLDTVCATPGNYGYRASKAALTMYTRCLVDDLPANASVFAVHPGEVKTDMNPHGTIDPWEAVTRIYGIVENWRPELQGKFVRNDGTLF